jgi:hypothetical protein
MTASQYQRCVLNVCRRATIAIVALAAIVGVALLRWNRRDSGSVARVLYG